MDPKVRQRMIDCGGTLAGAEYRQTDATFKHGGICRGCCIDWLRRQILGGIDSRVAQRMNPNVQVKYKEGGAFHEVADSGAFGAFFRGHDADVRTRQVAKYNEVNAEVRRLETEYGDKNATLVGRINQAGSCGSSAASEAMGVVWATGLARIGTELGRENEGARVLRGLRVRKYVTGSSWSRDQSIGTLYHIGLPLTASRQGHPATV